MRGGVTVDHHKIGGFSDGDRAALVEFAEEFRAIFGSDLDSLNGREAAVACRVEPKTTRLAPRAAGTDHALRRPGGLRHWLAIDFYIKSSIVDIDTMSKTDNLQGALELLVMKILRKGSKHGFAIAAQIQDISDDVLRVEAGSLYPALHRMTEAGLLKAEWRVSEAGRRARFYELTAKGRKQVEAEEAKWRAISTAVAKVLRTV